MSSNKTVELIKVIKMQQSKFYCINLINRKEMILLANCMQAVQIVCCNGIEDDGTIK